jgi:7-cyano-7-deazaguanine synthase
MDKAIVLCDGGINSAVTAARARRNADVHFLFVDHGQAAASAQRQSVEALADRLKARSMVIDLPHVGRFLGLRREATADDGAVNTHIHAPSEIPGLMSAMLAAGLQLALRTGASTLQTGASESADEIESQSAPGAGSPDHRRDFFYLSNLLMEQLQGGKLRVVLETPLIDLSRDEIIKLGVRYETPFELLWSCKSNSRAPCGICRGCVARAKAFSAANVLDPATATA